MLMMLYLYGLQTAVSKLTSEQQANNKDLSFKKFTQPILIILFSFSLSLAAIMFGLAPYLTNLVGDEKLIASRSEEHTSELQSRGHLVCRLLLEKKKRHLK